MKMLGLILSSIGSLAILGCVFIGFAFKGEAYKYSGPMPAPEARMQRYTLLIGFIPSIFTALVFIWDLQRGPDNALHTFIYWLPLIMCPPVFFAAMSTFFLSERIGAPYRKEALRLNEEKKKSEIATLRIRVEKGQSSLCELVNSDPESTREEIERCSQQIDGLPEEEKWKELQYFINKEHSFYRIQNRIGFKVTWTDIPQTQHWFLRTYLALFLKRTVSFSDPEDRKRLYYLVEDIGTVISNGLNHPTTVKLFVREFLPLIKERLRSEAKWDDKQFMNNKFGRNTVQNLDNLLAMKLLSIEKEGSI